MEDFSKRDLICCLVFPGICFVSGLFGTIVYYFTQPKYLAGVLPMLILGGIIPILLMIKLKINVGSYFKPRAIITAVCYAAFVGMEIGSIKPIHTQLVILIGIADMLYQILHVQDELTTARERAVLILSDPVIYWTAYYAIVYYVSFGER